MSFMRPIAAVVSLLALAACTDTGTLTPLNGQAQEIGVPQIEFRRGLPQGPVKVTMPDGEVLNGRFAVAQGGGFATVYGTGGVATATAVGAGGNVFISASGPRTSMTCQAQVGFGHGGGICRTVSGAEYQVMF